MTETVSTVLKRKRMMNLSRDWWIRLDLISEFSDTFRS